MTSVSGKHKIVDDEHGLGPCLVLQGPWHEEFSEFVRNGNITGVRLSEYAGWSESRIDFLEELDVDLIASIEIYSRKVSDVTCLQRFRRLKKVGLQTKDAIGFRSSNFGVLEHLFYFYTKNGIIDTIPDSLRQLKLDNYPFNSLAPLPEGRHVSEILIGGKRLESLDGIDSFPRLRRLTLLDAASISEITAIKEIKNIESVRISGAVNLMRVDTISCISNIRELRLINCGKIESLLSIPCLKNLEVLEIGGNTVIVDGKLDSILKLPKLRTLVITPRKSYEPSVKQVLEVVRGRNM